MAPRASFAFRSTALDVGVDGADLWVASGYGIELLDRTVDPPLPKLSLALPGTTRAVRASNGLAYVASDDRLFVVRRDADALRVVKTLTAGGTINDLLVASHLYVATSKGIEQYDLAPGTSPSRTAATFEVTSQNVQSLALSGTTLYAADGDSSVEVFNVTAPTAPLKMAALQSLPRSIGVHVSRDRVYISDGQNTDVFLGAVRAAQFAYGSTAFATIEADEHFVAGIDRTVRAVDFAQAARPVERFAQQLAPNGGTNNRVFAMQRAGARLYVAAGDIGLVSLDTSAFVRPYGLANYRTGATASVAGARVASPSTGMTEYAVDWNGIALTVVSSRPAAEVEKVHDDGFTSKGKTAQLSSPWTRIPWNATYDSNVREIVMAKDWFVALLENGTIRYSPWTDVGSSGALLDLDGRKPTHLAGTRSARFVVASITEEGNTELLVYGSPLEKPERTITVPGAASGNIATRLWSLSEGSFRWEAALFTYRGINLVDLVTGAVSVIPGSDTRLYTQIRFAGLELLATTDHSLVVWDLVRQRITREIALPGEPVAFDVGSGLAIVATNEGVTAVRWSDPALPVAADPRNANRYFTRVAAAKDRIYLSDADSVEIYSTEFDFLPHYVGSIATPGLGAISASDRSLFTLANDGTVRSWTRDGAPLAQRSLNDGSADWQPLGMHDVDGSPWVSYSRGCATGGCERLTVALDPVSLAPSSTLTGEVADVALTASRAALLFRSPSELRTYDRASTSRPTQTGATAVATDAVSLASSGTQLFVIGTAMSVFEDATLTPVAAPDPQPVQSWHERVRISGSCGLLSGRRAAVELRSLPGWKSPSQIDTPSTVRTIALAGSRAFVLTDHSLEVLDGSAAAPLTKRRAVN